MTEDRMAVLETVRKAVADGDVDFLREGVRVLAEAVLEQDEDSPGVRSFDGKTWRQYLDGHDAIDMEVAPDGRVWVRTAHDLYRITPEADAGSAP